MTTPAPTAPPLRGAAPTDGAAVPSAVSPVVVDPNAIAESIASSSDPVALLTYVVLAVASRSASAAEQGVLLSRIQLACSDMSKRVRVALLDSVNQTPGEYEGFEITARAGSRSVDYERLAESYPDVYGEVVKVGAPSLVVRYRTD